MKYYFIYKWTNYITFEYYIGKHYGTTDDGYTGSGTKFIKKYRHNPGSWYREILFRSNDLNVINFLESFLVNKNTLQCPLILNQVVGGKGGFSDKCYECLAEWRLTEKAKNKMFNHGKWLAENHGKAVFQREGFQSWAGKQNKGKVRNKYKGTHFSKEDKEKLYPKYTCPKCGLNGNKRGIIQWHGLYGEKCKRTDTG
jgi:hypothetical protein